MLHTGGVSGTAPTGFPAPGKALFPPPAHQHKEPLVNPEAWLGALPGKPAPLGTQPRVPRWDTTRGCQFLLTTVSSTHMFYKNP